MLQELVAIWYSLMVDHHKDRDCHFYIETDYRYSGEVVYSAQHSGYIIEDSDCNELSNQQFATQHQAEQALERFLIHHIKEEANVDWMRKHYPTESAAALLKLNELIAPSQEERRDDQ